MAIHELPTGNGVAHEEVAVGAAVATLTEATVLDPDGEGRAATAAYITVDDQPIRFTIDGTTPDADTGHSANVDDQIVLRGVEQLLGFKAVQEGASPGGLEVTYVR